MGLAREYLIRRFVKVNAHDYLQGVNPQSKRLELATTANQDPLLTLVPVIGVDVWEHAFYLQYLNVKVDYLNAIWSVINFDEAEKRYLEAVGGSKL